MEVDTNKIDIEHNEYDIDIRERLHSAVIRDVNDLFATVREIGTDLDRKIVGAMEDLDVISEELPNKLEILKSSKAEILDMRKRIKLLQKEYKSHCDEVISIVKEHAPDLIEKLEGLSKKQYELAKLKADLKGEQLLSASYHALSNDPSTILTTFREVTAHQSVIHEFDETASEAYGEKVDELAAKIQVYSNQLLTTTLDNLRFPFDESVDNRAISKERTSTTEALWLIRLTSERADSESGYSSAISALFARIDKRFRFHFSGNRKTNDLMKPEWYFTQLSTWLQCSLSFFELSLRDVLVGGPIHPADEFVRLISVLANEKTTEWLDSDNVKKDPLIFSHLIDEAIQFENTRKAYDPSSNGASALLPFCDDTVISRWSGIEKMACEARVDELLQSGERWHSRFCDLQQIDMYRVCECADAMVSLLDDLIKRAHMLPIISARKRLIDVVVALVEEFRCRLAHIANTADRPTTEPYPQVMNASWYLATVFEEWAENSIMISHSEEVVGFEESAKAYRIMWKKMATEMVNTLGGQVEPLLLEYKNQDWQKIAFESDDLTPQMCPILMTLRTCITAAGEVVSPVSFPTVFVDFCKEISNVFLEDVLMCNSFSIAGASKMLSDVVSYLIPLFKSLALRYECIGKVGDWEQPFSVLVSALRILSLPLPECRALSQALRSLPDDVIEEKLLNMQMIGIDKEKALKLISRRNDVIDRSIRL